MRRLLVIAGLCALVALILAAYEYARADIVNYPRTGAGGDLAGSVLTDSTGPVQLGGVCPNGGTGDTCVANRLDVTTVTSSGAARIELSAGYVTFSTRARMAAGRGFVLAAASADPCGSSNVPNTSMFYNTSDDVPCYCDGSGTPLRFDGSTPCFSP